MMEIMLMAIEVDAIMKILYVWCVVHSHRIQTMHFFLIRDLFLYATCLNKSRQIYVLLQGALYIASLCESFSECWRQDKMSLFPAYNASAEEQEKNEGIDIVQVG